MTDWKYERRTGQGWLYNESEIKYNSSEDESGDVVLYNTTGTTESYSYPTKN